MTAKLPVQERYKYEDLAATTLDGAIVSDHDTPRDIRAFEDLAGNSVRSMNRLASLADNPDSDIVWAEAATLAREIGYDASVVHAQVAGLLKQHSNEWRQFLASYGSGAWIANMVRGNHGN
jgi:hypothetical protein